MRVAYEHHLRYDGKPNDLVKVGTYHRGKGLEFKAVFLPGSGQNVYRRLRSLLREAASQTNGDRLKLAVLDLPGKSHVEVTATFATVLGARVLSRAFPLQDPTTLARGFAEQA